MTLFPLWFRRCNFLWIFFLSLVLVIGCNRGPKLPDRVYQMIVQPDKTFQVPVEYSLAKLEELVLSYPGYDVQLTLQQVFPDVTNSVISDTLGKPPSAQINLARNKVVESWIDNPSTVPTPFFRSIVKISETVDQLVEQAKEGSAKTLYAQIFVSNQITDDEASKAQEIVSKKIIPHSDQIGSICLVIPQQGPNGDQWSNHEKASTVFTGLRTSLVAINGPSEARSAQSCLNK